MSAPRCKKIDDKILKSRGKHFKRKRAIAQVFEDAGQTEVAQALRDCEETQILIACSHCNHSWYVVNRCRKRVCPLCSYKVAKKRAEFIKGMVNHMKFPKMITVTMERWTKCPRDGIKLIRKHFGSLRKDSVFSHVKGGAYQIELKHKPGGWHIHIHAIVDSPYIHYKKLFMAWSRITGIAVPQTDVRAARNQKQLEYQCKYASKASDFGSDIAVVVEWYHATKGSRLFTTFGTWYNKTIEDLDREADHEEWIATCPECGEHRTIYRARERELCVLELE